MTDETLPTLDARWLKMYGHLDSAAGACLEATLKVDTSEAKALISEALAALMDASFWCAYIERDLCNDPLAGVDDAPRADSP